MRKIGIARLAAVLAVLALAATACGGDDAATPPATETTTPEETGSPTGGGETVTVSLQDNVFDPVDVTVASGAELEMVNEGQALHNLTISGTDFDKDVQAGETETETVEVPAGEYDMICEYHESIGMVGTITVTG
jgi:plastocyanin